MAIDNALRHQPDEAAYWVNRGNICEAQGDWQRMSTAFERALSLAPQLPEARTALAVAWRQLGRRRQALGLLEQSPEQDYDWLCEYVLLLLLQGAGDKALKLLDQVPDSDSLQGVADYVAEAGHGDLAAPLYRRVLQLDPDNDTATYLLASLNGESAIKAPRAYVEGLYDRHAGQFEQRLVGRLGYRAPELLAQALATRLPDAPACALDLGCGSGLLGQSLRRHFPGLAVDGLDVSAQMLAQARSKGCYRALHHGDAITQLALLPAARYPLIASTDMLIYLGDLEPLFAVAVRCLEPGGLLALTVEAGQSTEPELQPSGRFRHSRAYLEALTDRHELQLRVLEPFDLRREKERMLEGLMLIAQAPITETETP
ncbi:hypothetical protein GCM10011348_14360 [Marinobacterium nitratireducens]|uniref:Methyltransferase type 12 domain-containing protein n=2 Tax=Marinobacterium nitratireducens TaxID=518897 RepID=A0A917ZAD4_9GAMM|nr:hypothetical protein GCM10011348_14360 [Marinobacterium nitratireducens]